MDEKIKEWVRHLGSLGIKDVPKDHEGNNLGLKH